MDVLALNRPTWLELENQLQHLVRSSGAERAEINFGHVTLCVYRDETDLTSPISRMLLSIDPHGGHYRDSAEGILRVLHGLFPPPVRSVAKDADHLQAGQAIALAREPKS